MPFFLLGSFPFLRCPRDAKRTLVDAGTLLITTISRLPKELIATLDAFEPKKQIVYPHNNKEIFTVVAACNPMGQLYQVDSYPSFANAEISLTMPCLTTGTVERRFGRFSFISPMRDDFKQL